MSSKPSSKRPTASEIGTEIIRAMDEEFRDAPDRVVAIVGAAYLDSLLEQILRAVLIQEDDETDKLLKHQGPLSSHGARCQLAYCLGIITKSQRDELSRIAKIRNAFAHEFHVRSFEAQDVKKFFETLHPARQDAIRRLIETATDPAERAELKRIAASGPKKDHFRDAINTMFITLLDKYDRLLRSGNPFLSQARTQNL